MVFRIQFVSAICLCGHIYIHPYIWIFLYWCYLRAGILVTPAHRQHVGIIIIYALHILNCRHECGNMDDTVTLVKQINTPTLLLPYEQMYIQSCHRNNELVPGHLNEHNPMFDLLHSDTARHNPPDA